MNSVGSCAKTYCGAQDMYDALTALMTTTNEATAMSSVVMMPLKNAPLTPSFDDNFVALLLVAKPGIGISQTPRKLNAIVNTSAISEIANV